MPIIIKDFTWKQTDERLTIQVPLRGIHPSKVDIFTSSQYIKATFGSFFFEALLRHPVDISQSSCIKTSNVIVFDLKKNSDNIWDSLEITDISKEEKNALKTQIIQEEHEQIQKGCHEKINKKAALKRVAINEQIELDTKTRNQIERIKKAEENKALGDLNEWKTDMETNAKAGSKTQKLKQHKQSGSGISKPKPTSESSIPKPRNTQSLQILFTPREFPTPSRESRLEEENDFLAKQAEARRSVGFVDKDLRPEEKNPQYLLAKGKEFLRANNYLGAISAFSFGIKLSPKFVDLYLSRSEVHIIVGNFNRAVDDCTNALNLLKPPSPINIVDRAICLGRRGCGLYKLGFLKQGISELEASVKLYRIAEFENILEECRLEFDSLESKSK